MTAPSASAPAGGADKKAPPKAKAPVVGDEAKPVVGRAWVTLTDL